MVSENHLSVNDPFESDFKFRSAAADTNRGFFGKNHSEKSELLNEFIFTTNENQNRRLGLGKERLAGSEFSGNTSQTVSPNKHFNIEKFAYNL